MSSLFTEFKIRIYGSNGSDIVGCKVAHRDQKSALIALFCGSRVNYLSMANSIAELFLLPYVYFGPI